MATGSSRSAVSTIHNWTVELTRPTTYKGTAKLQPVCGIKLHYLYYWSDVESDVWGHDYHGGSNIVDAVVKSLRKKLTDQASLIEPVHGTGYRLARG